MAQCLLCSNSRDSIKDPASWVTLTNQSVGSTDWFPKEQPSVVGESLQQDKSVRIPVSEYVQGVAVYAYLQGFVVVDPQELSGNCIFVEYSNDNIVLHNLEVTSNEWTMHTQTIIRSCQAPIETLDSTSTAPVMSKTIYSALAAKSNMFVDMSEINVTSLEHLSSKLSEIVSSEEYAVRCIKDTSTDQFINGSTYFSTIYRYNDTAICCCTNCTAVDFGYDMYFYGKQVSKSDGTLSWSWAGPYWVNPPYKPRVEYMLADGLNTFGMYIEVSLSAGEDLDSSVTLFDGGVTIDRLLDFSYHVDNYITEFNSATEFIEITYDSRLNIRHTTTSPHTIYLKMKYTKSNPA